MTSGKKQFTAFVVVVSDKASRGERKDESGPLLEKLLQDSGFRVGGMKIIPDDIDQIRATLIDLSRGGIDFVVTTGGTGVSSRDVTPEATREVIKREIPGLAEAMREESRKSTPNAMLSRALAGTRDRTLVLNLPGSPRGAIQCLQIALDAVSHALEIINGETSECAQGH
ncbi:MAG: MogA/MoaB family molybdenum cofactor biosynthesis protein [Actinomycetota bacterium]|nr:MogA/MoaB family molybdenum cofactor biosynthesis protein [Actinomycetota bacterium]